MLAVTVSKAIQIRDVPNDVHATPCARAAAVGMSMSEYLLRRAHRACREAHVRGGVRAGGGSARWCSHEGDRRRDPRDARRLMVVADASRTSRRSSAASGALSLHARLGSEEIYAPFLLEVEALQTLRRPSGSRPSDDRAAYARRPPRAGTRSLPHRPLMERVWDLRDSLSAHDARRRPRRGTRRATGYLRRPPHEGWRPRRRNRALRAELGFSCKRG